MKKGSVAWYKESSRKLDVFVFQSKMYRGEIRGIPVVISLINNFLQAWNHALKPF